MKTYKCCYCRKLVRDKPILGTLHVCLSPAERLEMDYYRGMAEMQKRWQAEYASKLDSLMAPYRSY